MLQPYEDHSVKDAKGGFQSKEFLLTQRSPICSLYQRFIIKNVTVIFELSDTTTTVCVGKYFWSCRFQIRLMFKVTFTRQRLKHLTGHFVHTELWTAWRLRGCLHEKTRPGTSFIPGWLFISYRVYMITGSFHISLFEGTLHVDKIHIRFKIANITHALPVPVYRQTDFTPKHVVISRFHVPFVRFRTGVKFSPRYNNRGELTSGWLAPA